MAADRDWEMLVAAEADGDHLKLVVAEADCLKFGVHRGRLRGRLVAADRDWGK